MRIYYKHISIILHIFSGAKSRSQFLSDFLQILTHCRITSSRVCYLKSAKSVGNFRFYEEPCVRMCITSAPFMTSEGREFKPHFGRFFQIFWGERGQILTNSDLLGTNLILFFSIKDVTSDLVEKIWKKGCNHIF